MKRLILLVEDDSRLASLVKQFLEQHEFDVVIEGSGYNVVRQVDQLSPDLVILDLGLPGRDGLAICRELRTQYSNPILILTARNSDSDQVAGLEYGADDYVAKPADPRVLLARVRALLRRIGDEPEATLQQSRLTLGRLSIDYASRCAKLDSKELELTSHEFDLLGVLTGKAGEVLSREYLFNIIYGRAYDGLDRTIDVRVSQLRKKLGDNLDKPELIKTIWGRGYLLVSDRFQ